MLTTPAGQFDVEIKLMIAFGLCRGEQRAAVDLQGDLFGAAAFPAYDKCQGRVAGAIAEHDVSRDRLYLVDQAQRFEAIQCAVGRGRLSAGNSLEPLCDLVGADRGVGIEQ